MAQSLQSLALDKSSFFFFKSQDQSLAQSIALNLVFQPEVLTFFFILFLYKTCCGYLSKAPHTSKKYPQHMFLWRNTKIPNTKVWQNGICKQCRPRSDCSWRSNLISVYTVCHATKYFKKNKIFPSKKKSILRKRNLSQKKCGIKCSK